MKKLLLSGAYPLYDTLMFAQNISNIDQSGDLNKGELNKSDDY